MAEMIKTIEHLVTEIGPRPVATEEEQQAALYVAQQLETLGLPVEVEEFQGSVSHKKTRFVCSVVAVVCAVLSLFLPVIALPAVLLTFVCAVLFTFEELGRPVLSKVLDKGISQNVVGRYIPPANEEGSRRSRKVILVARTDSGSVRSELKQPLLSGMPALAKAARIGMLALPVFLLLKSIFFLHATGVVFGITTILLVVICICAALPAISFAMEKASGLNDGANSSASGIAVMLEVARRISSSAVDSGAAGSAAAGERPVIHGAQAAFDAGAVPVGAQLVYEEEPTQGFEGEDAGAFGAASGVGVAGGEGAGWEGAGGEVAGAFGVAGAQEQGAWGEAAGWEGAAAAEDAAGVSAAAAGVAAGSAGVAAGAGFASTGVAAGAVAGAAVAGAAGVAAASLAAAGAEAAMPVPETAAVPAAAEPVAKEVPSWFAAGRAAARQNKPATDAKPIKRSTLANALEAAEQRLNAASIEAEPEQSLDQQFRQNFAGARAAQMQEQVQTQMPAASFEPAGQGVVQENMIQQQTQGVQQGVAPDQEPAAFVAQSTPAESVIPAPESAEAQTAGADPAPAQPAAASVGALPSVVAPNVAPNLAEIPAVAAASVATTSEAASPSAAPAPVAAQPASSAPETAAAPAAEQAPAQLEAIPMDYFMAAAVGANAGETVAIQPVQMQQGHQQLVLPDLSVTGTLPVVEVQHQRAPLAEAEQETETTTNAAAATNAALAMKNALSGLPSIDEGASSNATLLNSIPSLSGALEPLAATQAFTPSAGATGSFTPVTEALALEAENEEDLFVDDVDDSGFEENYTDTGAYAGPEYVDMPKKHRFGFFGKLFGRKKKEEEAASYGWSNDEEFYDSDYGYGSDEGAYAADYDDNYTGGTYNDSYTDNYDSNDNYNANEGGNYDFNKTYDARDLDDSDFGNPEDTNDFSTFFKDEDETWNGGAFSGKLSNLASGAAGVASKVRGALPHKKGEEEEVADYEEEEPRDSEFPTYSTREVGGYQEPNFSYDDYSQYAPDQQYSDYDQGYSDSYNAQDEGEEADYSDDSQNAMSERQAENQEYARVLELIATKYEAPGAGTDQAAAFADNAMDSYQQQIEDFRAGGINTEVWYVALGAETDCHAGMEEFIEAHRSELRGAIIIELDSLGAGTLSIVEKEGALKPVITSSRMRRYAKRASQLTGVTVEKASILWGESAASTALRKGLQAMHLVGMEDIKPAYYAQADDTLDNIDPVILEENANFVVEIIKGI